jgi:hypothetical protein
MPVNKTVLDLGLPSHERVFDEAELAAVAFLARYSGRILDAYRQDLRSYFTCAAGSAFEVARRDTPTRRAVPPPHGTTRARCLDN